MPDTQIRRAARTVAHDGQRSTARIARRMFTDLMSLDPEIRRGFFKAESAGDQEQILRIAMQEAGTPLAIYVDDPVGFIEDVLDETLWSKSREVVSSVAKHTVTAVPSCFGSSKTFSAARVDLWWSMVHAPGTALAITLAPLWRQVVRQMWPEIRRAHSRASLPGRVDTYQMKQMTGDGRLEVVTSYGLVANRHDESATQGIHCFDDQTELLTDQGWKPFPEVTGAERVLTLNGDVAEWGPITEVWRHPFDGYLNLHDGERVNFAITDNHRLLVRGRERSYGRHSRLTVEDGEAIKAARRRGVPLATLAEQYGVSPQTVGDVAHGRRDGKLRSGAMDAPRWQLREYADLPEHFKVRRTNTWGGSNPDEVTFSQPPGTPGLQRVLRFAYKDWAAFLGWYVAEGWTHIEPRGAWRIGIAQEQGTKYEEIAALLDRMGIRYTRGAHSMELAHKGLALWLREHCGIGSGNKRIPASIKEASAETIDVFLDAYGKGDGTAHTHEDGRRYITSSRQLADDLHEVLCKLGRGRKVRVMSKAGSETVMSTTGRAFARRRDVYLVNDPGVPVDSDVRKRNVERMRYTGTVYCVSTPHQTIMVRRKGCSMWSGNSPHLLVVVDEAGGIPATVGSNLRAILTGDDSRMLAIGNPPADDEGGWFERLCAGETGARDVNVIPISAYSTPDLTGERAPRCKSCPAGVPAHTMAKHLVTKEWVEDTLKEFGEESPYVQAKVYARFPRGGADRALPYSWVELARDALDPDGEEYVSFTELGMAADEPDPAQRVRMGSWIRLGVDVAADGGDELVVARMAGDLATIRHTSSGPSNADPTTVAGKVLVEIRRAQQLARAVDSPFPVRVKVDGIGVGWGVSGILEAWGREGIHDAEIVRVVVSESTDREPEPTATFRPRIKRDEMWLAFRELLPRPYDNDEGVLPKIRLRVDRKTVAQLTAPEISTSSSGATVVESKANMRKRGMSSPDRAEALLLAAYEAAPPKSKRRKSRVLSG